MEKMIDVQFNGLAITATPKQAAGLQLRADRGAPTAVRQRLRLGLGDAGTDVLQSAIATAKSAALVAAASAVVASEAVAITALKISTGCNKRSARLANWILAR